MFLLFFFLDIIKLHKLLISIEGGQIRAMQWINDPFRVTLILNISNIITLFSKKGRMPDVLQKTVFGFDVFRLRDQCLQTLF